MFMVPKSGVVEIMPVNYRNDYYHNLAISSGLYYLSHVNFTMEEVTMELQEEVYVPPITLWMIMTDMANSVAHNKYHVYQYSFCYTHQ